MDDPIASIAAALLTGLVGLLVVGILMLARLLIRLWRMPRHSGEE